MFPTNRVASIAARMFCAYLAIACIGLVVVAASASAATARHCAKVGHVAPNIGFVDAPDFYADLPAHASIDLPGDPNAYSDYSAYTWHGVGTQQYACTARHGVDRWVEWRTRTGHRVATFDGVKFTATRNAVVAAWKG